MVESDVSYARHDAAKAFGLFLALHLLLFTALPTLLTSNLPLDTIEALAWGHEWQWGYYKHPPMSGWLADIFRMGTHDWPLYLLSQVMVTVAFAGVWWLALDLLGPTLATASVMALEGIHYCNLTSIEFNANVVMYPFWAWASLAFWRALKTGRWVWWAALGLACGLGALGKYVFLALPASMLLYLLLTTEGRAQWKRPGPWLATVVFAAVVAPHVVWLLDHGCPTLSYALDRGHADPSQTTRHWAHELFNFLAAQALALLPMVGLLALLGWRPRAGHAAHAMCSPAERWALVSLGLGPLLLFVLAAVVLQISLLHMWAAPLFFCSAPLLLAWKRPQHLRFQRFHAGLATWLLMLAALYTTAILAAPRLKHRPDRTDYPGRPLAQAIERQWHQRTSGRPLPIVVGETFVAGNVAAYSADHPSVYIDAKPKKAFWLNDALVRERGAVFVWSMKPEELATIPDLQAKFPGLQRMPDLSLTSRTGGQDFKTTVAWAMLLPPSSP